MKSYICYLLWLILLIQSIPYLLLILSGTLDLDSDWYCMLGTLIITICGVLYIYSHKKNKELRIYKQLITFFISIYIYIPIINDDFKRIGIGLISIYPKSSLDGFFIITLMMLLWSLYILISIIRYIKNR